MMAYQIMLVDDESVDLEWLARRIRNRYDKLEIAATVNSGFAALQVLREKSIDILLSDIHMPIMSGIELATKAKELHPHVKIVFISGHEDFGYAKQAIKLNAAAYLLKPVDDHELHETLLELANSLESQLPPADKEKEREQQVASKQNRKIIDLITVYVKDQIESKITLKMTADHFGFSPNYLGQLFKEETGEHFSDFLVRVRMQKACELLLDPRWKVYEIADRIGYKNILYFNRQFKQHFNMTPGEYRKANHV
ncbi:response regulator [Paenibacillus sp. GCM10023248]|uniref:response regulator transcription factor n=1 Tax=Bacillales TaxID=1385 RepID=UPI0023790D5B|nr:MULTISPECIES: response regulator [Bacillales]MDD9268564.1 response regulator [Paenibacillus sp. MAHUQ-63]MDR6879462.1 YesN/AraC family two-component response regulator [Bacillus sp. 3255]